MQHKVDTQRLLCARVWCSFEKMKENTSKLFLFPRVLACVS